MALASVMCRACGHAETLEVDEMPQAAVTAAQWALHFVVRHPEIEDVSEMTSMVPAVTP